MRKIRFLIIIILVLGVLLYTGNYIRLRRISIERYKDLESFRRYRMGLPEEDDGIIIAAVGDIMLSRLVDLRIKQNEDNACVFDGVKWFWQDAHIVFGNLENPLTSGREIGVPEMVLRADPEISLVLKDSGFNMLSLANNHIYDFGSQGLFDTISALDGVGIKYCGAAKDKAFIYPTYFETNGTKVTFLAFTDEEPIPELAGADKGKSHMAFIGKGEIETTVEEAAKKGDFVIVYLHGGTEYTPEPDKSMKDYAHFAIDKGADLVLGSHPHVVQRVKKYRGKYIFYSLGNFIFDQLWSEETRESIAVKVHIRGNKVRKMEFLPIYIGNDCFPSPIAGEKGQKIINKLGLDCYAENIPAWDKDDKSFIQTEQYVYHTESYRPEYRLTKESRFDLDGDGEKEKFILKDGCIEVWKDSKLIWSSPEEWWVDDFFLGDADNDGIDELCLLVWKTGSFGSKKPFWFKEEDTSFKNHLFLFKLSNGEIKPTWQSSNLDRPNFHATLVDYDDDGKNELLVTEGSYTDFKLRKTTLWEWNGWGFSSLLQGLQE